MFSQIVIINNPEKPEEPEKPENPDEPSQDNEDLSSLPEYEEYWPSYDECHLWNELDFQLCQET